MTQSLEESQAIELRKPDVLRGSFFMLSRAFYSYINVLELVIQEFEAETIIQPGMGHVLFALWEQDDVTMTNLVSRTDLAASSLTRLIRKMEEVNLVTRKRCDQDGRAVRVQLTEFGRSQRETGFQVIARLKEIVESGMSQTEIRTMTKGLESMISNMDHYTSS